MKKTLTIAILAIALTACNSSENTPENVTTTSTITLSGDQRVAQTITTDIILADANGIENALIFYNWFANDAKIANETGTSITLDSTMLDQSIHVEATFLDDDGYSERLSSASFTVNRALKLGLISDLEKANSFSHSDDNGQTWSSFSAIPISHIDEYHYEPAVATDYQGNLVAVSISEYNPNFSTTNKTDYDIVFSYSHDSATTWSEWALINPDDTTGGLSGAWSSDDYPKVITDEKGTWMIAWDTGHDISSSGLDDDIFVSVSEDNGVSWTLPTLVNNYGASDSKRDSSVDLALFGDRWFAVWQTQHSLDDLANSDFDVVLAYSDDKGATWSNPVYISDDATTDSTTDGAPQIAFSADGQGLVAWSGTYNGTDTDIYIKRTTDGGTTWANKTAVNSNADTDTTNDSVTDLTISKTGTSVVAWAGITTTTGTDREPQMSYSTDAGVTWADSFVLNEDANTNDGQEYFVNITEKPDAGWIFSWVDNSSGDTFIRHTNDLVTWESMINLGVDTDENIALFYY